MAMKMPSPRVSQKSEAGEPASAKRRSDVLFMMAVKGGEKGGGEGQYKDDQIYKSPQEKFKNGEEPTLAVNLPDRQENLRHKRDP